jgi:hypothetical protein
MPKREKWHGKRALLNGPGYQSTAAIVAEIEDSSTWPAVNDEVDTWRRPSTTLQIANCDRSIAFDMDWVDKAGMKNDLKKIDIMIDCLTKFRAGLELEQQRMIERCKQTGHPIT